MAAQAGVIAEKLVKLFGKELALAAAAKVVNVKPTRLNKLVYNRLLRA